MDRNRVWVAGRINRSDVPQIVWNEVTDRFYYKGELKEGVNLVELASYAAEILPMYEVVEAATGEEVSNRNMETLEEVKVPEMEGTYSAARAEVLAKFFAFVIEIEGSLMPRTVRFLRATRDSNWLLKCIGDPSAAEISSATDGYSPDDAELREIRENLQRLSERFLGYLSEVEIAKMIMDPEYITSRSPIYSEVEVTEDELLTYGTVTIRVEPWVPREVVSELYSYHQTRLSGRRPRSLSRRNLRVTSFAFGRLREIWRTATETYDPNERASLSLGSTVWRSLAEEWNEAHPDLAYKEMNLFRRDVVSTLRQTLRPYDALTKLYRDR